MSVACVPASGDSRFAPAPAYEAKPEEPNNDGNEASLVTLEVLGFGAIAHLLHAVDTANEISGNDEMGPAANSGFARNVFKPQDVFKPGKF